MIQQLNVVPFVSVDHMMKLVHAIGIERMLSDIAAYIEDDFRRWEIFDKTPRIASHSLEGVIELMPTSDGKLYGSACRRSQPSACSRTSRPVIPSCSPR